MRKFGLDQVLQGLPPPTAPLVEAIVEEAERCNVRLYLVGGPVRDLLLERPIRDVDLVVEVGQPIDAGALADRVLPEGGRLVRHERFGTLTLSAGDARVDLANSRRETYARPGALPKVEPGSLEDDLRRRDFTVNALALPLAGAGRGVTGAGRGLTGAGRGAELAVVDCGDGVADLAARRLRVFHARSFHDDPTRALRAARLAPRLGFTLTRGSRSLLRDAIRDGVFGAVSGDRLRREIERLFDDARLGLNPSEGLRRLEDWHVLPALEPGLSLPAECKVALRRLGRWLAEPVWPAARVRGWAAGLCVWLAPLPPALRRRTLQRFSVRGDALNRIAEFPKLRDGLLRALARARGRGAVDATLGDLDDDRLLALYAWADPAIRRRIVRFAAEDRARRAPVTGVDLTAIGLVGPSVGRALARVREAFLDGVVANREEAVALAREVGRRRGGRPQAVRRRRAKSP